MTTDTCCPPNKLHPSPDGLTAIAPDPYVYLGARENSIVENQHKTGLLINRGFYVIAADTTTPIGAIQHAARHRLRQERWELWWRGVVSILLMVGFTLLAGSVDQVADGAPAAAKWAVVLSAFVTLAAACYTLHSLLKTHFTQRKCPNRGYPTQGWIYLGPLVEPDDPIADGEQEWHWRAVGMDNVWFNLSPQSRDAMFEIIRTLGASALAGALQEQTAAEAERMLPAYAETLDERITRAGEMLASAD